MSDVKIAQFFHPKKARDVKTEEKSQWQEIVFQ